MWPLDDLKLYICLMPYLYWTAQVWSLCSMLEPSFPALASGCSLSLTPVHAAGTKMMGSQAVTPTAPLSVTSNCLDPAPPHPHISQPCLQQESQNVKVGKYLPHCLLQSLLAACGETEAQNHMDDLDVMWSNFPPSAETSNASLTSSR